MYNSPLQRHGRIGNLEGSRVLENTLNAATIRNHEQIRDIAKPQEEGELPKATYHRQCPSIFTLERNLDKLSQLDAKERENCNSTDSRRSSIRQPTANPGRIYQRVCIFCEKDKYTRNSRTREEQCVDMHADETIRKAAAGKCDNRILAVISRELVVAEARSISHAIAISAPEISLSLGIRKKTASIPNTSKPNGRNMTTLEPICYKILGF